MNTKLEEQISVEEKSNNNVYKERIIFKENYRK